MRGGGGESGQLLFAEGRLKLNSNMELFGLEVGDVDAEEIQKPEND